jgi:hypothetical protein
MRFLKVSLLPLIASVMAGCALLPGAEQCTYSAGGYVQTCMGNAQPNLGEARRKPAEYDRSIQQATQIRSDADRQCAGYGFVSGTTPFAQCVMQIDIAQRAALERRQQVERLRSQRYSQCKLEEGQMWLEPGRGDFFQTATRVRQRFESCMAGLPPPPSIDVICNRVSRDQISCSSR